jgi:SHS2 domain-containing protein
MTDPDRDIPAGEPGLPPPFERIAHTADVGVRVRGGSPESVFERAAGALFAVMLERAEAGGGARVDRIAVDADDLPALLQAWLSELLYRFTDGGLVGTGFATVRLDRTPGSCAFEADVRTESYDPARHVLQTELKAVTFHQLRVEEREGGWEAQVIFDV